jgi:hypothetical protein
MRKDEEHCKTAFDTFLKQQYQALDIVWADGDRNKPPDYFLQIRSNKYAVEVTSIIERTMFGNRIMEHIEIDKSIKNFIESIKRDAIDKNILNGAYIVRYKPIIDFGKQKQAISIRIRDYLLRTQSVSSAPEEVIAGQGHLRWYIYKVHSDKSYLSVTTGDAKWNGEAEGELVALINEALEEKVKKLINIPLPKILLLYDRFVWIDASKWNKYLGKLNNVDQFHTIFLISDKSVNSVLHSIDSSWLNRF